MEDKQLIEMKDIVESFRTVNNPSQIFQRIVNVINNSLALRINDRSFQFEQILIFNLYSLNYDSNRCTSYLEKSVTAQAQLIDPLYTDENQTCTFDKILMAANKVFSSLRTIETRKVLLSNISTASLQDSNPHNLSLIQKWRVGIEAAVGHENMDCDLLINRLYPLEHVSDISHVDDVNLLNVLLIKMKSNVHNSDLIKEINNLQERKSLGDFDSLFTFFKCLVYRSMMDKTSYKRCLNSILESDSVVLEPVKIEALLLNGFDLVESNCFQLSLAAYYQVFKDSPSCVRGIFGSATALKLGNNLRSAIELLKIAVKIRETKTDEDTVVDQYACKLMSLISPCKEIDTLKLYEELGNLLLISKDYQQAASTFVSCLKTYENSDLPSCKLEKLRLGASFALLLAGNSAESVVISQFINSKVALKRKLASEPLDLIIHFLLGKGYLESNQTTKSIASFDKAMKCIIPMTAGPPEKKVDRGDFEKTNSANKDSISKASMSLTTYSRLRSRIYFEKSKLFIKTGDRTSFKQCMEATLCLDPGDYMLNFYSEHFQSVGENRDLQKLNGWKENNLPGSTPASVMDMKNLDIFQLVIKFMTEENF